MSQCRHDDATGVWADERNTIMVWVCRGCGADSEHIIADLSNQRDEAEWIAEDAEKLLEKYHHATCAYCGKETWNAAEEGEHAFENVACAICFSQLEGEVYEEKERADVAEKRIQKLLSTAKYLSQYIRALRHAKLDDLAEKYDLRTNGNWLKLFLLAMEAYVRVLGESAKQRERAAKAEDSVRELIGRLAQWDEELMARLLREYNISPND